MNAASERFRWIYENLGGADQPSYNEIIYESESFLVIPSLGSMVPGWVLIVPKRPVANLSMLNGSEAKEMESVSKDISRLLSRFAGNVYEFEHGGPIGSSVSCGVDQAHLHLVPLEFDLLAVARRQSDFNWQWISGIEALGELIDREDGYLFMKSVDKAYYSKLDEPVSQWYRRLIANCIGKPHQWDYRQHPNLDIVDRTLRTVAA